MKVLWDLNGAPSIGFSGIWAALKTGLTTTPALAGIHSFAYALNTQIPSASANIASILSMQAITLPSDPYGTGELFFGTPAVQDLNPLYLAYPALGMDLPNVCVNNSQAPVTTTGRGRNRSGEFRFLRVASVAGGSHTVTLTKLNSVNATSTPYAMLYDKTGEVAETAENGVDTQTLTKTLDGGDYVLAVTDLQLNGASAARTCFNVRID